MAERQKGADALSPKASKKAQAKTPVNDFVMDTLKKVHREVFGPHETEAHFSQVADTKADDTAPVA